MKKLAMGGMSYSTYPEGSPAISPEGYHIPTRSQLMTYEKLGSEENRTYKNNGLRRVPRRDQGKQPGSQAARRLPSDRNHGLRKLLRKRPGQALDFLRI